MVRYIKTQRNSKKNYRIKKNIINYKNLIKHSKINNKNPNHSLSIFHASSNSNNTHSAIHLGVCKFKYENENYKINNNNDDDSDADDDVDDDDDNSYDDDDFQIVNNGNPNQKDKHKKIIDVVDFVTKNNYFSSTSMMMIHFAIIPNKNEENLLQLQVINDQHNNNNTAKHCVLNYNVHHSHHNKRRIIANVTILQRLANVLKDISIIDYADFGSALIVVVNQNGEINVHLNKIYYNNFNANNNELFYHLQQYPISEFLIESVKYIKNNNLQISYHDYDISLKSTTISNSCSLQNAQINNLNKNKKYLFYLNEINKKMGQQSTKSNGSQSKISKDKKRVTFADEPPSSASSLSITSSSLPSSAVSSNSNGINQYSVGYSTDDRDIFFEASDELNSLVRNENKQLTSDSLLNNYMPLSNESNENILEKIVSEQNKINNTNEIIVCYKQMKHFPTFEADLKKNHYANKEDDDHNDENDDDDDDGDDDDVFIDNDSISSFTEDCKVEIVDDDNDDDNNKDDNDDDGDDSSSQNYLNSNHENVNADDDNNNNNNNCYSTTTIGKEVKQVHQTHTNFNNKKLYPHCSNDQYSDILNTFTPLNENNHDFFNKYDVKDKKTSVNKAEVEVEVEEEDEDEDEDEEDEPGDNDSPVSGIDVHFFENNLQNFTNNDQKNLGSSSIVCDNNNFINKIDEKYHKNNCDNAFIEFNHLNKNSNNIPSDINEKNNTISSLSLPDIVESIGGSASGNNNHTNNNIHNNNNNNNVGGINVTMGFPSELCDGEKNNSEQQIKNNNSAITETMEQDTINNKLIMTDLANENSTRNSQIKTESIEKQQLNNSQEQTNSLLYQINELERNLTVKTWNVERLQAELQAAYKEGECVKKKLKLQETEMESLKNKFSDKEEEFNTKYYELELKHELLQQKYGEIQKLTSSLQLQLINTQSNVATIIQEKEQFIRDSKIEREKLEETIREKINEKCQLEIKWQTDFEQLRTVNSEREEHLLQDCEWKLRLTEQKCKAKTTAAEELRRESNLIETEAKRQMDEVKHLKSFEAEVKQLRGLTNSQTESINSMTQKIDDLKYELEDANRTITESIETIRKIKVQSVQELGDKQREMIHKIDEARGEVACLWEDRLMEEMGRLKIELESCYAEDRTEALQQANNERMEEIAELTKAFTAKEKELTNEIEELKKIVLNRDSKLAEANDRSDQQVLQIRVILDRAEREHQREINAEIAKRDLLREQMQQENERERTEMEERFCERLTHVTQEFSAELTTNKEELQTRHKKKMDQQYEKLMAEKEEAIQDLERKHKRQLIDIETKLRDMEILHQRNIKDMKSHQTMERSSFEQRDLQSAQEIETLHRKCRCLTKLFEEMRMRYERRDPRPEDLREIEELKRHIETQDNDVRKLTEKLRELQIIHLNGTQQRKPKNPIKKSQKVNCDVIYEENEDGELAINANNGGGEGYADGNEYEM